MNQKITNFFNFTKSFLTKHSPEILTGTGIAGMIFTTILAVKETPKALDLIEMKKDELKKDKLTVIETVKAAWIPYISPSITGILSISCIIGASRVNMKRNTALAAAYSISEQTLVRYRDKVIETIGERKEKEIHDKLAQDRVDDNKLSNSQIFVSGKDNTLCMDTISGRYFKSGIETIKQVVNKLNRRLVYENYISLNEFYYELGLDGTKNGDLIGWNLNSGLIEPMFSTCLTDDDQPCIVIDFMVCPKYDYDKII